MISEVLTAVIMGMWRLHLQGEDAKYRYPLNKLYVLFLNLGCDL
jgi:hypothetical protein